MTRNNPISRAAAGAATATALGAAALTLAAATIAITRALRFTPVAPGSVVVITGGSRGLGLSIALRFAQTAVKLVLCSRNLAELQQAQSTLLAQHSHLKSEDFYLVAADLSKPEQAQRLIDETIARFGRIDVLVNNAGIINVGPIESQTLEIFERTMQVNFFAALYTTWAALPHLRKQPPLAGTRRAAIVNIASIGGKIAVPHMLPYSASKFALVGFSEGLHAEIRHKGIHVLTICPGLMRTGGEDHAKFVGNTDAERRWFMLAAKTPGVAVTADYAASRIYNALAAGRAEITISPQAFLAARFGGLCPETLQYANALTNHLILPISPTQTP
jgi:short-subunit dehydrogenase